MPRYRVLFVCMGNICRSPTAEAVFLKALQARGLSGTVDADSAGTAGYHVGEPPDRRAQHAARRRGYDLSSLRARKATSQDFECFDRVLAMDRDVLESLQDICPPERADRLALFMEYAPHFGVDEVPDPYYGGADGFERVLDMVEAASVGLLDAIERTLEAK